MRIRRRIVGFLLSGLAILCVSVGRPDPPREPRIRHKAERIQIGMTQTEVEDVIGIRTYAWAPGPAPITEDSPPRFRKVLLWSGDCDLLVYLDENGRVIGWECVPKKLSS